MSLETALGKIKPAVRNARAYTLKRLDAPVKINQNENPFDMPAPVKEAVARIMDGKVWSRYPAFVPTELIQKLAEFSHWVPEGILVGNGSNELIQAVLTVTVEKGKTVAIPQPTFTLYELMTTILGGEIQSIPLTSALEFNVAALRSAIQSADVTIICSPNNPTGCLIRQEDLRLLLQEAGGLVVLDEAYHEFSRQTAVPLLREFDNLVVLRTFSKAMAMAGLRVGYLVGNPALVKEISKAKLPYNLNVFSMAAAQAAVEHFELLRPQIDLLIRERERVYDTLMKIPGIKPYPSHANFIAMETVMPPGELFEALYVEGLLVRDVSRYPMLEKFLRISIGSPEENDQLLAALTRLFAGASKSPA
jgi:histidinol-phosphate aminotransferase